MAQLNGLSSTARLDDSDDFESADVDVDCLIIGTGPAGASLACFLAQHGITGLIVTQDPSNADTPR